MDGAPGALRRVYSGLAARAIVARRRIRKDAEGTMRTLAMGAAIVLCLAASGCAGTAGPNGFARGSSMDSDIDYGKVLAVNEWAERRRATVVWINYPKKSAHSKDDG